MRTAALKAALELDLFTAIGRGGHDPAALAELCGASPRGIRMLCDSLVVDGFLVKRGGRYELTPDTAAFLDRRSPAFLGSAVRFLTCAVQVEAFDHLAEAVRKGGTILPGHGSMEPDHPIWEEFARDMGPMMATTAALLATEVDAASGGRWKVLDIAAGHGQYGIAIARGNPNARIVALDWPRVLNVARENARKAGVAGRYSTIEGSVFEVDLGRDYDLVLLTNFLHHFDQPTCETLLRKVHAALKPGGRAATVDFVPNEDRVSPPTPAGFALTMLATTECGDAYTFAEFDRMFRNAGFARSELRPLRPTFQDAILSYR